MNKIFSTSLDSSRLHLLLLILRAGIALFMLTHGFPKLIKIFNGDMRFSDPIGIGPELTLLLAMFSEAICSVLVFLGLGTRLALIPLIFTMLTVVFVVHVSDGFGSQELPLLYLLFYITLFIVGPGKYSMDHHIKNK